MIASALSWYWDEVRGNVLAILPCGLVAWIWIRGRLAAAHRARVELMAKHLEHDVVAAKILRALDPEEDAAELHAKIESIADQIDPTTAGGIGELAKKWDRTVYR